jgi:hypothetical protein
MTSLTPSRRRGVEILDDPKVDPGLITRSMKDVERANVWLGGKRAALAELEPVIRDLSSGSSFLDVGPGRGDIAAAVKQRSAELGKKIETIGLDNSFPLVKEMNRVARTRVVISDLRRSVVAASGLWVGSFLLGFHPVSRHDGVVSVMRGFLPYELEEIVTRATGHRPIASRRLGFRLTTSWAPVS